MMTTSQSEDKQGNVSDHEKIALRAYFLWLERGCPCGSPHVDWFRAERELLALTADNALMRGAESGHARGGRAGRARRQRALAATGP